MQKKELIHLIDSIFIPLRFERKGNTWRNEAQELIKIINLQKSSYGNLYYVNYGFDLRGLDYEGTAMHIFRGLALPSINGKSLLDFDNDLNLKNRGDQIILSLQTTLSKEFDTINTLNDLVEDLKNRSHLNDVPVKVKEYLGIG